MDLAQYAVTAVLVEGQSRSKVVHSLVSRIQHSEEIRGPLAATLQSLLRSLPSLSFF